MNEAPHATAPALKKLRGVLVELVKQPGAAKTAADRLLEPLVRFYNGEGRAAYGRKTKLAHRMSELSGRSVTRSMVSAWLNPAPAKRRQPSLAYGLLLLTAAAEQMAGAEV